MEKTPELYVEKVCDTKQPDLSPAMHRRLLNFVNAAVRPDELMFAKAMRAHTEADPVHEDDGHERHDKRRPLLSAKVATALLDLRDREFPLGFRHARDILDVFDRDLLGALLDHLSDATYGSSSDIPQPIPRRGPGSRPWHHERLQA